ncbi:MAG: MMPL family transporter [Saccharofermentanales bacterium]
MNLLPAMQMAMKKSLAAVFSSSITTVVGFLALIFMRFRLGADLGLVMAKGIALAFITVMVFMPTFILIGLQMDRKNTAPFLPAGHVRLWQVCG